MRRQEGYGLWTDWTQPKVELDTVQCRHCQRHIWVKPGTLSTVYLLWDRVAWRWTEEPGAWCRLCWGPVCLPCHDLGTCDPVARQMERADLEVAKRDALMRLGRLTKGDPA